MALMVLLGEWRNSAERKTMKTHKSLKETMSPEDYALWKERRRLVRSGLKSGMTEKERQEMVCENHADRRSRLVKTSPTCRICHYKADLWDEKERPYCALCYSKEMREKALVCA
jgi:hypothetical protein